MSTITTALESTVIDLQYRPPSYPIDERLLCALLIEWTHALHSSSLPTETVQRILRSIATPSAAPIAS